LSRMVAGHGLIHRANKQIAAWVKRETSKPCGLQDGHRKNKA
jgi:hypothetical protein